MEPTPRVPFSTPLSALRVLGVMVAVFEGGWPVEVPFTMAKRAAVLGVGGGKEPPPAIRGVKPVLETSGVRPVLTNELSKAPRPKEV